MHCCGLHLTVLFHAGGTNAMVSSAWGPSLSGSNPSPKAAPNQSSSAWGASEYAIVLRLLSLLLSFVHQPCQKLLELLVNGQTQTDFGMVQSVCGSSNAAVVITTIQFNSMCVQSIRT